jgi:putative ABC transport system permease protein
MMESMIYGVSAHDAATYVSVALILIVVAMLASYIPARRALRVNAIIALFHE